MPSSPDSATLRSCRVRSGCVDGDGDATGDEGIAVSLDRGKDIAKVGALMTAVNKVHNIDRCGTGAPAPRTARPRRGRLAPHPSPAGRVKSRAAGGP
ncbi:hypothetical protein GCM10022295_74580 [Streptomyces osmaniensis]|uniref:Transposase n=1 Tax=Streptomyces osmaniensis TaxID=593134 RepID=A0ABP6YH04_9ACTN